MKPLATAEISTLLCLGAHADDIEIGCGGTLLEWLDQRPDLEVHWYVFSAAGERRQEAEQSAARFLQGARRKHVHVLDYDDSYFPTQWSPIKRTMAEIAQQVQPDVIFTHHRRDRHQDHRVLAELSWCGFRDHLICEYEIPKYEGDLGQPNVFVPLDAKHCTAKTETLLDAFPSQREKRWFDAELFAGLMRLRGSECNAASGYAEAFHVAKSTWTLSG